MDDVLESLKEEVLEANLVLAEEGLVLGTWGNASGIDLDLNLVVIKPSGVPYEDLTTDLMAVVDLDGKVIQGDFRPSSDTETHLALYRAFPEVGGIVHTHSHYATCWAQACLPIPCLGTTHADYFHGDVPVTEKLTEGEVIEDYERNTGDVIVRQFRGLDPLAVPAVLVAQHGPFTWGETVEDAVESAVVLEEVASMAFHTIQLAPDQGAIGGHLLEKHFLRKHGAEAYYGQAEGQD